MDLDFLRLSPAELLLAAILLLIPFIIKLRQSHKFFSEQPETKVYRSIVWLRMNLGVYIFTPMAYGLALLLLLLFFNKEMSLLEIGLVYGVSLAISFGIFAKVINPKISKWAVQTITPWYLRYSNSYPGFLTNFAVSSLFGWLAYFVITAVAFIVGIFIPLWEAISPNSKNSTLDDLVLYTFAGFFIITTIYFIYRIYYTTGRFALEVDLSKHDPILSVNDRFGKTPLGQINLAKDYRYLKVGYAEYTTYDLEYRSVHTFLQGNTLIGIESLDSFSKNQNYEESNALIPVEMHIADYIEGLLSENENLNFHTCLIVRDKYHQIAKVIADAQAKYLKEHPELREGEKTLTSAKYEGYY